MLSKPETRIRMTFIAAIAAAALIVWGIVYALRGSLLAGCVAFLIVGCCFNDYFFKFDVGPVTLTLERLLLAALVVVYAVQRCLGRTDPKAIGNSDVVLVGLLGFLTISLLTGDEISGRHGEVPPHWRLLAGYLMPAVIYWIARQSALTQRRVSGALLALAAFGLYLSLTGLLEIAGQWSLVFPQHIADPKLGLHFGRARGPMLQSVSYGTFVSICLLSAWIWRARLGRVGSTMVAVVLPLFAAAIYFSYTRSVWLGAGLGIFLVLGLTLHRSWRTLVLGGMISAAVLLVAFKSDAFMGFQREYSAGDTRDSAYLRVSFAYVSWQMLLDRPLMGCGLGRFAESKLPYLSDRSTALPLEQIRPLVHHNHYLSLLTETGILGLGLFLALMATWARNAWQMLRHQYTPQWIRGVCVLFLGTLCVLGVQWMFHELSYSPIDHSLLFLLAGITVGLRPQAFRIEPEATAATTWKSHADNFEQRIAVTPA
jgi:O-antigen ligase